MPDAALIKYLRFTPVVWTNEAPWGTCSRRPEARSLGSRMHLDPRCWRIKKYKDWIGSFLRREGKSVVISQRRAEWEGGGGGLVGHVRGGGSIALQQAIKKKLVMSPGESWPCRFLAICRQPLFPCCCNNTFRA